MSERKRVYGGGVAPLLLISANGFCRARRELYALIMQRGGVGGGQDGRDRGVESEVWEWVGRGKESGVSLSAALIASLLWPGTYDGI